MPTKREQIASRIREWGPGTAFTPKDFLDLAPRGTVDVTLGALLADSTIRKLRRGLYDYPRYSELLKTVESPDLDQVARALARRHRWTIIPAGALAAHLLGLSTQVPARAVYISDGPTKKVTIGRQTIHFKNARPKETGVASVRAGTVIQALRHLGKRRIDRKVIDRMRRTLTAEEKRDHGRADVLGKGHDSACGATQTHRQADARELRTPLLRHVRLGALRCV